MMISIRAPLAVAVLAAMLLGVACQSTQVEQDEPLDAGALSEDFCRWQAQCFPVDYAREYESYAYCVAVEVARHADPSGCTRANAAFKECFVALSCEEAQTARPIVEELLSGTRDDLPEEPIPCSADLLFYALSCAEFACGDGQVVNRKLVCNRVNDCANAADEVDCP